ncbi:MAG: hypothetical protein JWM93_2376 [Frankiales bacterium]|nr:hypothetical protein [Frankiales bacterium]
MLQSFNAQRFQNRFPTPRVSSADPTNVPSRRRPRHPDRDTGHVRTPEAAHTIGVSPDAPPFRHENGSDGADRQMRSPPATSACTGRHASTGGGVLFGFASEHPHMPH